MILLAALGLLSMLAQVVILRELVAALFGVELLYIVALGTWMAGTAAGAAVGRWLPARAWMAACGFAALGVLVLAELAFVRTAGVVVGAVPGAYLPFPVQLAGIVAATLPLSGLCGVLFPPLAALARAADRGLGRCYAAESAGAAIGGMAVTLLFWLGVSTFEAAALTTALALLAASAALAPRRPVVSAAIGVLLALGAITLRGDADAWDGSLLRWQYPSLISTADTPYARVVVTKSDGQLAVFHNGALAFDTEGTGAEAFADLAALQHPSPARALVVGGGPEGVADALAAHGLSRIDNVEVDARADELVRRFIPMPAARPGRVPATRTVIAEPRRFLEQAGAYDLILVAMPEPASGEASRFYTQEFFRLCGAHLARGGVLAVRLPAAENFWPPPLVHMVATIVRALETAVARTSLVPGATLYVFGSDAPLPEHADILVQRLAWRRVTPRLMTPPYLAYLYAGDRRADLRRRLNATAAAAPNRDAAPVAYQYSAMLWLSKFYPGLAADTSDGEGRSSWMRPANLGALAAAVLFIAVLAHLAMRARRGAPSFTAAVMLALAGSLAMMLEAVLLLRYQIANGVVFVNVGWLLTCFMAGLTAGAWHVDRIRVLRVPARWRADRVMAAGWVCVATGTLAATRIDALAGLAGTSVLLAAAGAMAGAAFGYAAGPRPPDARRSASALYAADVAGGAAGAWVSTLLLVPLIGLDGTALVIVALVAPLAVLIRRSASAGR